MDIKTIMGDSERIPAGFIAICPASHPRSKMSGMLVRNRNTGVYVLIAGGCSHSVPHKWAQGMALDNGKGSDSIQDALIEQMTKLGLNPNKVAEMLDGQVSRSHVCDYLTRRSSIGSHKLQHLITALKGSIKFD